MIRWLVRIGALYVAYKLGKAAGHIGRRSFLSRPPTGNGSQAGDRPRHRAILKVVGRWPQAGSSANKLFQGPMTGV